MKTKTVNLLELSDSQKLEVLEQAKTFLQRQIEDARFCNSVDTAYRIGPQDV